MPTVLLDTQLLIWAAEDSADLPAAVRALLLDADVDPAFSAASIWEVAIKSALGREDFRIDATLLARGLRSAGYAELQIDARHAAAVGALPFPGPGGHRDPFDRLLLAQARMEGIDLATADRTLARYGEGVRLLR